MASPKVPRRVRLPPQRGAWGLLSSVEEWGRGVEEVLEKLAGAALVWCAGPGSGGAAEGEGARPHFRRGGGRVCWLAEQGLAPGVLLLARCLVKSRGFALLLSSCPNRCAWMGTALLLASGGQVPLPLPTLSGCREGPGHGAVPGYALPASPSSAARWVPRQACPLLQPGPVLSPGRHLPGGSPLPGTIPCPLTHCPVWEGALDWAELEAEPWTKDSFPAGASLGLPGLL